MRRKSRSFPLVANVDDARPLMVEVLLGHQRLHALAAALADGDEVRATTPAAASDSLRPRARFMTVEPAVFFHVVGA